MQEPQFNASGEQAGDEEWRKANLELFFRGGLEQVGTSRHKL